MRRIPQEVPMQTLIATLKVQNGKQEEARTLFRELSAAVRANEPGTLAYVFHQRKDDPLTFCVYEKYASEDAFKAHGANLAKWGPASPACSPGGPRSCSWKRSSAGSPGGSSRCRSRGR
jgi:quinol monooxygenase YgiN